MSVSAVSAVLENSKSKGLARLVFVCIAERMGKDGRAWCGLRDIGKRAAIESRNVPRLIKELQKLDELLVVGTNATTKSNVYQISPSLKVRLRRKSHGKTRGSLMVSRGESHGETSGTARIEPSMEPITPPTPPTGGNGSLLFPELAPRATPKRKRQLKVTEPSEQFLQFWDAYPRHVKMARAWKAWQKADPPLAAVLESLAQHKKTEQWRRGKEYIPHPATWINDEQWDDEL